MNGNGWHGGIGGIGGPKGAQRKASRGRRATGTIGAKPAFLHVLLSILAGLLLAGPSAANAEEVEAAAVASFADTLDALQETIREEGLLPGQVFHLGEMLRRTGPALGRGPDVYRDAVVVQFCSAQVAWAMATEDPRRLPNCPLGVAVYVLPDDPARVHLAYRAPGADTPARRQAGALLSRVVATTLRKLDPNGRE